MRLAALPTISSATGNRFAVSPSPPASGSVRVVVIGEVRCFVAMVMGLQRMVIAAMPVIVTMTVGMAVLMDMGVRMGMGMLVRVHHLAMLMRMTVAVHVVVTVLVTVLAAHRKTPSARQPCRSG